MMENRKTALITGASAGIGRELCRIHAENGGDLVITARREERLNELKRELEERHGCKVMVIAKDLALPQAAGEIHDAILQAGVEVDYLVNNAGFGGLGIFHEQECQAGLGMIQVNIAALTALTRLFLPEFAGRDSGRILNVSSTASLVPGPLQAVYYATKAYVTSFSHALAEELRDTNVTVTALLPGPTETEFAQRAGAHKTELFGHASDARTVAQDGYNAMLAGKLTKISGVSFGMRVMLALTPFVPEKILLKQVRRMHEGL